MTITFDPDGAGSQFYLAGEEDTLGDGPFDHHISNTGVVQSDNVIGADAPARFHRGNRTYPFRFTVKKKHASYEACWQYILTHIKLFTGLGAVAFVQGDATLTLSKCDITADGHPEGATSVWVYSGTGVVA